MEVSRILKPASVRCETHVSSKKHALDILSEMLANAADGSSAAEILEGLVARERLGSTGLGGSVAMPHTRQPGVGASVAAVLKLDEPIDFDAPDGNPVALLFGVLVPEDSDPAEVQRLVALVKKLRDADLQRELRAAADPLGVYDLIVARLAAAGDATIHD